MMRTCVGRWLVTAWCLPHLPFLVHTRCCPFWPQAPFGLSVLFFQLSLAPEPPTARLPQSAWVAQAMAAVNIPKQVLAKLATIADCVRLSGMAGDIDDPGTVAGSFIKFLRATAAQPALALAALPPDTYKEEVDKWKVPEGDGVRDPSLLERGQAVLVGRAARLAAGVPDEQPQQQQTIATATMPSPTMPGKRYKLTVICSTYDESEVSEDLAKAAEYADAYSEVYGEMEVPKPREAPSPIQLAAVEHLINSGVVPYLDFAVWGPFHYRIMRRLRIQGQTLSADGTLTQVEISGPPTFRHWKCCYKVMKMLL